MWSMSESMSGDGLKGFLYDSTWHSLQADVQCNPYHWQVRRLEVHAVYQLQLTTFSRLAGAAQLWHTSLAGNDYSRISNPSLVNSDWSRYPTISYLVITSQGVEFCCRCSRGEPFWSQKLVAETTFFFSTLCPKLARLSVGFPLKSDNHLCAISLTFRWDTFFLVTTWLRCIPGVVTTSNTILWKVSFPFYR